MSITKQHLQWILVVVPVVGVFAWTSLRPFVSAGAPRHIDTALHSSHSNAVRELDAWFDSQWASNNLAPADAADELLLFRRLNLALHGTVPSIQEIREFEADVADNRLYRWTNHLIEESRFVDYFGGRLMDGLINPLAEDVKPFHRFRFQSWLGEQIQLGTPYDELVRDMVSGRGTSGDHPGTIFAFAELSQGEQAAERLAARTVRAFLGQRIDCAQCHDHPFDHWKQHDFEGIAAFYAPARLTNFGVQDPRRGPLVIEDMRANETREVVPRVPFHEQWLSKDRHTRDQLAAWLTHTENRRFRRAIANRLWGQMFGKPLIHPVDDIPDPESEDAADNTRPLDILGDALAENGYDLKSMIHIIAASRVFHLQSSHPGLDAPETTDNIESSWAAFPLTQLSPEQYIRSLQQSASISTLNVEQTGTVATLQRYMLVERFLRNSEMASVDESAISGTVPQTIERLMGNHTRQMSRATPLTGPGRISLLTEDAESSLNVCYLACLTRLPTEPERTWFLGQLSGVSRAQRSRLIEDLYWSLYNSAEFCWNH